MKQNEIKKKIKELEEEMETVLLQGCDYSIENWFLPERERYRRMLKDER